MKLLRLKTLLCSGLIASNLLIQPGFTAEPEALIETLVSSLNSPQPRRLVVLDLQPAHPDQSSSKQLGTYLSEQLLKPLQTSKAFILLERSQLAALLKEQGFQQSALADPEQSATLGRLSGAEVMLIGTYSVLADQIDLNLRLVDVTSGEVLAIAQNKIPKTDAIYALLGEKTKTQIQTEMAGQVLNLLLGQMKQHPTQTPAKPSVQQGVFHENFANLPAGTPLNQWGAGMVVRQSQLYPMHVMTTENPATKMWGLPLAFPSDFVLEIHAIDTLRDSRKISPGLLQVALRDQTGQAFIIEKVGHDFQMAHQGVGRSAWRYQDWNVMALVKQGNRFSWYINGIKTIERTINTSSSFVALEVHSPSFLNWAFTNISLHAL